MKKAILHRKNALFYKSENGAKVGDVFMSLIHTAEQNGVNPFEYLTALLRHPRAVADDADAWRPWTYQDALAALRRRTGVRPRPPPPASRRFQPYACLPEGHERS